MTDLPDRAIVTRMCFAEERVAELEAALESIADRLIDQQDEPWPSYIKAARLHYWRNKAIKAANDLRALLPKGPTHD